MEKIIEKEFKTFKKSMFLKKHFKRMIIQNKMKQIINKITLKNKTLVDVCV